MKDDPITGYAKRVKAALSPECWAVRVARAHERARLVAAVLAEADERGEVSREAVRRHGPGMHWSTFRHCLRCHRGRSGPAWERQLDLRVPERGWVVPEAWKTTVVTLGHLVPQPSFDTVLETLRGIYGEDARLCNNTLRRLWREAGVEKVHPGGGGQAEKVTRLHGGGGLVLLAAANVESGAVRKLAAAALEVAGAQEPGRGVVRPEDGERDDHGRFTADFNEVRHGRYTSALVDPFYHSVAVVRRERDLSRLQVGRMGVATLENRLLSFLSCPLVTESRGTAGLDGPMGTWLAALSSYPYKSATADKTLAELKLLDAAGAMWDAHAATWTELSRRWGKTEWSQLVAYVDTTQDPYWTERFAVSGKVARTGRVQPCLSRVCLSTGPGVPIFTEVFAGTVSLREEMDKLLARADELLGPGELGRLTVVDAECGNAHVLRAFAESPVRDVVTVVKGALRQNRTLEEVGDWLPFREQDHLREARLRVADDLEVRVVEMARQGSRNPISTWFATTAGPELLTTADVAELYLSRWPHQEDLFRRGRDGGGLDRSHGYGVSTVKNLAVLTKREKAGTAVQKLNAELRGAISARLNATLAVDAASAHLAARKAQGDTLDGRSKGVRQRARQQYKASDRKVREVERQRRKALTEQRKQETTPDEIYVRDTALDGVTTCLKMTLLALLEFCCQEYFAGQRIMPRTFADRLVALPVTIRERQHDVIYEIEPNPRDLEMMALLAAALDTINGRQLRLGKRRLVARLTEGPE